MKTYNSLMQFDAHKMIGIIDAFLKRTGKSYTDLGRESGVGQPMISRLKKGDTENPTIKSLSQLANYMGMTVSELIGETPVNSDDPINLLLSIDLELFTLIHKSVMDMPSSNNLSEKQKGEIISKIYHDFEKHNLRQSKDLPEVINIFAAKYIEMYK